jgi:Rod binding domain-containing protein
MQLPPITLPAGTGAASRPAAAGDPSGDPRELRTREAARGFEAAFLAEMLQYAGLNSTPEGFGGGAGEEAFGSLLTEQYARLLTERGGIGLAERIFDLMKQGKRDA